MSARTFFEHASKCCALMEDLELRMDALRSGASEGCSNSVGCGGSDDPSWRLMAKVQRIEDLERQWRDRLAEWAETVRECTDVAMRIETGNDSTDTLWTLVLLRSYVDRMRPSEVAESLDVSVNAVYTAKSRALEWLDERFEL